MGEFQIRRFSKLSSCVIVARPFPGWHCMWHGYYQITGGRNRGWPGGKNTRLVELWGLLSILEYYQGQEFNFFELGAGRGDQCLVVAGVIDHEILKNIPVDHRLLAVEAEPHHYKWAQQAFVSQGVKAITVQGVVWKGTGQTLPFYLRPSPVTGYGQSLRGLKGMHKTIQVSTFTVDHLRTKYGFDRVHCVHMDVQGSESDVLEGCSESLRLGLIDHFIVGTHRGPGLEAQVRRQLLPTHRCLADIPRHGTAGVPGLSGKYGGKSDGVQIWRRRGLDQDEDE